MTCKTDPMVGSVAGMNDSSDNADLLDFCFLCSRQFFHDNLDNFGTERLKDEEILETFFEELGPVDRSLLQCCPSCQTLCKTLMRTKEALSSLIDEIIQLLLRSTKVSYLLPKSRVVSRLFQSSNSSLPPCETSSSYLQQPLSQINFVKDVSNHIHSTSNNCFPTQFNLRLDASNLSVSDALDLSSSFSVTTSVIKRSPLSKFKRECLTTSVEIQKSCTVSSFSSILNESIMNSISDNACDVSEGVIVRTKDIMNSKKSTSSQNSLTGSNNEVVQTNAIKNNKTLESGKGARVITSIFSKTKINEATSFSDISTSPKSKTPKAHSCNSVACSKTEKYPVEDLKSSESDTLEKKNKIYIGKHRRKAKNLQYMRYCEDTNDKSNSNLKDKSKSSLQNNKKKVTKFKCDVCSRFFQNLRNLRNHISAHNQERKFICEVCGISYRHKVGLEAHIAIHNGESKFKCGVCSKTFTQKSGLQRHSRIHTGKYQFQCDICGKQFLHHSSFNAHKMTHEGTKNYACSKCSFTFGQRSHLLRHMRVHTGEKPHKCHLCERTFAEKYNLQVHLKSHDGSSVHDHSCPKCEKRFTRKFKLELHINQVHGS